MDTTAPTRIATDRQQTDPHRRPAAQGRGTDDEAEAYMQAAQRLATLESIDLAVARAHTARSEKRTADPGATQGR